MTSSEKKRWAIVPPPTDESENIGEDLHVDSAAGALGAAKRRRREDDVASTSRPRAQQRQSGTVVQESQGARSSIQAISRDGLPPHSERERAQERAAQTEPAAGWPEDAGESLDTIPAPLAPEDHELGEGQEGGKGQAGGEGQESSKEPSKHGGNGSD